MSRVLVAVLLTGGAPVAALAQAPPPSPLPNVAHYSPFPGLADIPADAPRFPGDFPLPPVSYMLNPDGHPPGGKPPESSDAPSPTMAVARRAAEAALAACEAQGLRVGVAVLDVSGDLRVVLSSDSMPPGRVYTAIHKGLGAIEFGVPTSQIKTVVAANPAQAQRLRPGMAAFPGGVPLLSHGQIVGAVAVSGAKAAQDEACAAAGVASVRADL